MKIYEQELEEWEVGACRRDDQISKGIDPSRMTIYPIRDGQDSFGGTRYTKGEERRTRQDNIQKRQGGTPAGTRDETGSMWPGSPKTAIRRDARRREDKRGQ